jgi:hypothetical protein
VQLADSTVETRALTAARAFMTTLPDVAPGTLTHCSMHWAAMPYGWALDRAAQGLPLPYQVVADRDAAGTELLVEGMSAALNARRLTLETPAGVEYCASVRGRNSHGVAVSISAMAGAEPRTFGEAPIDAALVEFMCAAAGALCAKYGIDARFPAACYTHAEAAIWDGYFLGDDPDPRWDLAILEPSDLDPAALKAVTTSNGDRLRARVHAYAERLSALTRIREGTR